MTIKGYAYEREHLASTVPFLCFDETADIRAWRRQAKDKLTELLGIEHPSYPPILTIEGKTAQEDYDDYRFTVETEEGYKVPCRLLLPSGKAHVPLTICLSGHGGGMHIALGEAKTKADEESLAAWPHRAMALRALKEGRAALVVEARSFGVSSVEGYGTSCTEHAKVALLLGRTLLGERVFDVSRILDVLPEAFPAVDMKSIVCTGNSGGGTATYYLSAMDERIGAAAPSCSVCSFDDSIAAMPHCLCNHVPGIRRWFDMGDLAGLIAPRKLVIAAGVQDDIFPIAGTRRTFSDIQRIYRAFGAIDACALVVGEGGHLNYADLLWEKLHEMGV